LKTAIRILRNREGATLVEFAFGFPILIIFIWMIFQFGLIFRANSGIQHALGEGARFATLWPVPTKDDVKATMEQSVYGIGPGRFTVSTPQEHTQDGAKYWDLQVDYTQQTNMLLFPGPNIHLTKRKRVWIAAT
jgi:Flp pilus assembly protein TadG